MFYLIDKQSQEEEIEHLRPRFPCGGGGNRRQQGDKRGQVWLSWGGAIQKPKRGRDDSRKRQTQPWQPAYLVDTPHDRLREPFMGDPAFPQAGVRKRIYAGNTLFPNPLTGA